MKMTDRWKRQTPENRLISRLIPERRSFAKGSTTLKWQCLNCSNIRQRDPLKTKMAGRVRSSFSSPEDEEPSRRSRIEFIENKRRLIRSLAKDGFTPRWNPIQVHLKPNSQVWITDGMHRTASLLALGRSVPAVLVDPRKRFEP